MRIGFQLRTGVGDDGRRTDRAKVRVREELKPPVRLWTTSDSAGSA